MEDIKQVTTQGIPTLEEILRDHPGYLDEVVDTAGASRITNTPESTLTTLRSRGGGPRFVKLGSRVHYKRRALFEWLAQGERTSTSDRDLEGRGYEEPEVERPEARLHTNL